MSRQIYAECHSAQVCNSFTLLQGDTVHQMPHLPVRSYRYVAEASQRSRLTERRTACSLSHARGWQWYIKQRSIRVELSHGFVGLSCSNSRGHDADKSGTQVGRFLVSGSNSSAEQPQTVLAGSI